MKKLNKNGFTLIELLAVIIILGILMIIAIPSVTSYIQNSRKSAYVDTAVGYMDAVMKEVNSSKDLRFFSTNTLYLVAVGHDKMHSCVTVESGGQSPFSDEWSYAFVGVTYDGKGYSYYFISEDGAGQGVSFIDKKELTDEGTDYIYSAHLTDSNAAAKITAKGEVTMNTSLPTTLKTLYAASTTPSGFTQVSGEGVTAVKLSALTGDWETVFKKFIVGDSTASPAIPAKEANKSIANVVIVAKNGTQKCLYKEDITSNS